MLEELKKHVLLANTRLKKDGLVILTWGNASAFDPETKLVVIKPSGVPYETMKEEDMVVVDLDGNVVEGKLRPSSDLPTHLYLYLHDSTLRGIVHTHSTYATAFAQAGIPIPCLGTTHADSFYGEIPCTRDLSEEEIDGEYEKNTGKQIMDSFQDKKMLDVPAVLVKRHALFAFGDSVEHAVDNAQTAEEIAKMAYLTIGLNPSASPIPEALLEKHHSRKHGKSAYYGQKK